MKKTYLLFENKQEREKAINFLIHTNIKYQSNVSNGNSPCWIRFKPSDIITHCIDLYLNGLYFNSFSKINHK